MDELQKKLIAIFGEQRVFHHHVLREYLSTDLVAPAFLTILSQQELVAVMQTVLDNKIPYFILDRDATLLMQKKEISGIVIKNNARKFDVIARKGKMQSRQLITDFVLLEAESGVLVNQLVRFTLDEGLAGIEVLFGMGGTIQKLFQDASEEILLRLPIQSVTILTAGGKVVQISPMELKKDLLVLSVIFKLVGEDTRLLWLKAKKASEGNH